jgi:hypothetical protein
VAAIMAKQPATPKRKRKSKEEKEKIIRPMVKLPKAVKDLKRLMINGASVNSKYWRVKDWLMASK